MNLKLKIFSGFLILSLMLLVAGTISIVEFLNIGRSVKNMLDENYKSINASTKMIEALEREDSGVLLLLIGHHPDGVEIIRSGDSLFSAAFETASNNITLPNEDRYVKSIDSGYQIYRKQWEEVINESSDERNLPWYYKNLHARFLEIKKDVNDLMMLNQNALYHTASSLKSQAYRSITPGIIAIVASFVFAILFYFFIHLYIIRPIIKITKNIEAYNKSQKPYHMEIETHDEINDLNESIKRLLTRIR